MSDTVIHIEGLGKRYRIGGVARYKTLRDTLMDAVSFRSTGGNGQGADESIWALKNVSLDIKRGDLVGLIGRNGAGKSTLLKVLSRITEPTEGSAEIRGRVGSLLEVGTGFHPELSGGENVFLNGAILGMRKTEIESKFDEIVSFAEVEKFIDTPVKHYSTGMYLRLAFAVAAHLLPEILLVDEVLAVGDAQFQKKCFEKMSQMGDTGRTIVFVSHNMAAMRTICQRGIVLEHGAVIFDGEINQAVDHYISSISRQDNAGRVTETASFVVESVEIASANGPLIKTFDPVKVRVRVRAKTNIGQPGLYVGFLSLENQRFAGLDLADFAILPPLAAGESLEMGFDVDELPLLHGAYQLELHVKDIAAFKFEAVRQTYPFDVLETPVYGGRKLDNWFGKIGLKARPVAGGQR